MTAQGLSPCKIHSLVGCSPLYQLFYDGEQPPELPNLPKRKSADDIAWGSSGKEARLLTKFLRLFSRMDEGDLKLLFSMAQKMARAKAG